MYIISSPGTQLHLHFLTHKKRRNYGRDEDITSRRETRKIQIKLAATCNKNKQGDAKNISGFYTKRTKTTWKTFGKIIRRGRNTSINA